MNVVKTAKYRIGQVVRHRVLSFRGVIFDVDPEFSSTEEWYQSIPAQLRPHKDQPFYVLLAENSAAEYVAYVSEEYLNEDVTGEPVNHPHVKDMFDPQPDGHYQPKARPQH